MKKVLVILLSFIMLLSFAACGEDTKTENKGGNAVLNEQVPGHSFTYKGEKIEMGAPSGDIIPKLGEAKSVTEQPSCATDGMDTTYFYGSLYITTSPFEENELFYTAWFVDDSLSTEEGIYIGASKTDVDAAYGEDSFNGLNAYVITKGNTKLTIVIKDDVVSQITYEYSN